MLAAENVTLDVEKHDRQRLNASIPPKTKGHQIGAQALERSAAQGGAASNFSTFGGLKQLTSEAAHKVMRHTVKI